MAADYDWHPAANKGGSVFKVETRNLGWWVFLAVLVSIGIHIVLFFVLKNWERKENRSENLNFRVQTKQESIDRSRLEELLSQKPEVPEKIDIAQPEKLSELDVDQDFDAFDMMDMLKDEPIRMAPVDAPELAAAAMPQVPQQALDMAAEAMELSTAEVLSSDLQEMRNKLVDASQQVAVEQPVMMIESEDVSEGVDTDEFFKKAAEKVMGERADEFVKGYATLDDLIGQTGGIKRGTSQTAMMPSDILFEYGKANLREDAEISMIKLAYLVETNPDAIFIIEGHTDSFGGDDYNLQLSESRARSVRDWLVRRLRINPSNIRVIGKGKLEPIVPITGTAEEQELNRRVEIEIRKP